MWLNMGSDELFEAISHPLRIEIIKLLAEGPKRFADIKRELGIKSGGLLDFHLRFIFDVLTNYGHAEAAYRVATKTYPSWGYMIRDENLGEVGVPNGSRDELA